MQTNSLVTSMTFMFLSASFKQFLQSLEMHKNLYSRLVGITSRNFCTWPAGRQAW